LLAGFESAQAGEAETAEQQQRCHNKAGAALHYKPRLHAAKRGRTLTWPAVDSGTATHHRVSPVAAHTVLWRSSSRV
jgi:plastocyanin